MRIKIIKNVTENRLAHNSDREKRGDPDQNRELIKLILYALFYYYK